MKRIGYIGLLLVGLLGVGCDLSNDEQIYIQVSPVSEVTNPNKFAKDSITEISVSYTLPTKCNIFRGFYYEQADFNRLVAIESYTNGDANCEIDPASYTATLRFKPINLGTYHFKFWAGKDSQGLDQFIEFDATVDH